MTEVFQRLNKSAKRDRFKITFWIAILVPVILAPIQIVFEIVAAFVVALPFLFARSLAGAMKKKGFHDPVYKKNLQRLIERNRQFEEARKSKEVRNEPHS